MNVVPLMQPRVELDPNGHLVRAWLPSSSEPGKEYELELSTGRTHWDHVDATCMGFTINGSCRHTAALEAFMAEDTAESRAITVQVNPLALLDEVDIDKVMASKFDPSPQHIYSFRVKGQLVEGVSIDGVRDAARALATQGEAIREIEVRMDSQTDREAYFIAKAGRYAISPDGKEILMDTAIRAKRQPKWGKVANPQRGAPTEYFIDAWYEIGIAKAVRNATEALLPESLKDFIKAKSREMLGLPAGPNGGAAQRPQQQRAPQQQQRPQQAPPRQQQPDSAPPPDDDQAPPPRRAGGFMPKEDAPPNYPRDLAVLLGRVNSERDVAFNTQVYDALRGTYGKDAFPGGKRFISTKMSAEDAKLAFAWLKRQIGEGDDDAAPAPIEGEYRPVDDQEAQSALPMT